jgi:hypothetical protein
MDYCPRCHRHLDGAPNCPGCGVPADESARISEDAAPDTVQAAPPEERAYVAKPFHQEPPADVGAVDPDPKPAAGSGADRDDAEPAQEQTAQLPSVGPSTTPVADGDEDRPVTDDPPYGEDHPPRRRRRLLVFAVGVCAVLLAVAAFQLGGEEDTPGPGTESVAPTKSPERSASPSPSEPSADASSAESSVSAEPSEVAPQPPEQPEPEPTVGDGDPGPATTAPSEPTSDPTSASPEPDPSDDCILIICL